MKTILLPTDFSENSWNAINYALQLFKDEHCNFILLNTYTPIIYHMEQVLISSPQAKVETIIRDMSEKGLTEILERIEKDFDNAKHSFSKIASFNNLTSEVNTLTKDRSIDLIVMGTKGATGAKEILFGTNTVHIIKDSKCPVLAIPDGFAFETPHEILFPSDYEIDFKPQQIEPIIDLGSKYHSRINILHVSYGHELSEKQKSNRTSLESYFKNTAYLFHNIKYQNVAEAISDFQLKARINLLAMINNKHSFFENLFFKSKINQIGFHLNIPFLVIPNK